MMYKANKLGADKSYKSYRENIIKESVDQLKKVFDLKLKKIIQNSDTDIAEGNTTNSIS